MSKISVSILAASTFLFSGCVSFPNDLPRLETPAAPPSGSAPEPTTGYIVYSGRSQGKQNIYRQDMVGMVPSGNPVVIYEDTLANNDGRDARYPQVTDDGRYIVFITRETTGIPCLSCPSGGIDELVVIDHEGTEWVREPHFANYCQNINYPEIVTYEYDTEFSQTNLEVITMCADQWPPTSMRAFHFGPDANYFETEGQLDQMLVGEYALLPGYSSANGGYIITAQGDSLNFTRFEHNQPGPDKKGSGKVHIDVASRFDGGICPIDLSPCPVQTPPELQNVFAPSISPDGKYLTFNSEVYEGVAGRGQEFFVIDLPATDIEAAYTPTWTDPLGYLSNINDMSHANNTESSYGTFTVNGLHQYTIHGDGELQIAPDLNAVPITVPSPNIEVWETGWFYKN